MSFKLYLVYLYFAFPKPAVLLVEGIHAKLTCMCQCQNQSVAYILSGAPPAPGCLSEWTATVNKTQIVFSFGGVHGVSKLFCEVEGITIFQIH